MFKTMIHDPYAKTFTIIDTDFTETINDDKSGWHATIEIYSKRNLNVWANLALNLIQFCNETHERITDMLDYLNNELGINTDKLEKYLMLM